jgi:hypothetical protein
VVRSLGDREFATLVARGTTSRERQIAEEARSFEFAMHDASVPRTGDRHR